MNICENGFVREMTAEEQAAAAPFTPVSYDRQTSALHAVRLLLQGKGPVTEDEHIQCGALYDEWAAGSHDAFDTYTDFPDMSSTVLKLPSFSTTT